MKDIAQAVAEVGPLDPKLAEIGRNQRLPDVFYDAEGRVKVPGNIEDLAKQNGWKTVAFKTRGDGGFDERSNSLQIVVIPGASLKPPSQTDWFIQWSVRPDGEANYHNVSPSSREPTGGSFAAIAMVPHSDGKTYTPFYYLTRDGARALDQMNAMGECVGCHQNGLREISPKGYYGRGDVGRLPLETRKTAFEINKMMQKYESGSNRIDFGYQARNMPDVRYDPQNLGPAMGDTSDRPAFRSFLEGITKTRPTRNREFIVGADGKSGCAFNNNSLSYSDALGRSGTDQTWTMSQNPNISWRRVSKAMSSCVECHDGKQRSTLTAYSTGQGMLVAKILQDESMPAKHRAVLNADERIALVNCIEAESEAIQGQWLVRMFKESNLCRLWHGDKCEPGPSVPTRPGSPGIETQLNGFSNILAH